MKTQKAYFGGGCFWCLEASFSLVPGVINVTNGYAGGQKPNPSYDDVCGGMTGHAEVVEIEYNPDEVSFEELLNIFFNVHDPSQKNRQGNDIGSQYRSIILYADDKQQEVAQKYLEGLHLRGEYDTIYTELVPLKEFWPAEEYHQDYFQKHPEQAYCQMVVKPKVDKTKKYLENRE